MNDRERMIRDRAYEIWEREGRPEGRERDHWEQARREVDGDRGAAAAAAPEPSAPDVGPGPRSGGSAPGEPMPGGSTPGGPGAGEDSAADKATRSPRKASAAAGAKKATAAGAKKPKAGAKEKPTAAGKESSKDRPAGTTGKRKTDG